MKADKKIVVLAVVGLMCIVFAATLMNPSSNKVVMEAQAEDLEVTVYNSDLGVVKEYRTTYLDKGLNSILYEGVASKINPSTVKINSLDNSVKVLEQNYRYDLVSREKILEKYLGKEITAYRFYGDSKELIEGVLLSVSGNQLVLRDKEGKVRIVYADDFVLPELPDGLITKPALEWLVDSSTVGDRVMELSYMTSGMSWKADYVAVVGVDDDVVDLTGWVTVVNNAGVSFNNASLKLVAGDVNRVQPPQVSEAMFSDVRYAKAGAQQFAEESLFEYHMYDLKRKTTLRNNEEKQISLLSAQGVGAEKEYVYDDIKYWWWYGSSWSDSGSRKVDVMLKYNNSERNNLGIPLPAGTVRVFKKDSSGRLQFIGEDSIDHTPKDEEVRLSLGKAFDLVGERKQMSMKTLGDWYEYTWEVTLRNHKDEDVEVTVFERTGGDWEIVSESHQHVKESQNKIRWKVPVKANSEAKLLYTIRYHVM